MIKFYSESGKTNDELVQFAIYKFNSQLVSIDRTIAGIDPTIITPAVRRAVLLANGMTKEQCDILDDVTTEAKALNGQLINDLNPPDLNKLVKLWMAESDYTDAVGKVNIS